VTHQGGPAELGVLGQRVVDDIRHLFRGRAETATLWRVSEDGRTNVVVAASGNVERMPAVGRSFPAGTGTIGLVIETGRPFTTTDMLLDPRVRLPGDVRPQAERMAHRSMLAVPLAAGGRVVAGVVVGGEAGLLFDEEDIRLVEAFARQVSLALERGETERRATERAERLKALAELTRTMTSAAHREDVFTTVARIAVTLFGGALSRVWTADPARGVLELGGEYGLDADFARRYAARTRLSDGSGLVGRVAATRESLYIEDVLAEPGLVNVEFARDAGLRGFAGVPLVADGALLGVVTVLFPGPRVLTSEERELLLLLGGQAAIAVQNARLDRETRATRDFLGSVAENSADGFVTTDVAGRITYFSAGATKTFGYEPSEVLGRAAAEYYRGDSKEAARVMATLRREGRIQHYATAFRAKDGRWIEVDASLALLRDRAGEISGTVAVVRDVTDQRQAEATMRLQSAALEAAANAICLTDASGRIEWINPAFTRLTGYAADDALGATPRLLKSGQQSPEFYADLWRTILAGRAWEGEIVNRRKDGSLYIGETVITPVLDSQGRPTNFIGIQHDVSARRTAEDAQRRLTAVLEATTDFVGTATPDGRALWVNRAGRRMLGIPEDEDLGGARIADYHPAWAARLLTEEGIPAAVRDGVWSGETALRARDGREILVSQVIIAHKAGDGTLEFLSTVARDVTRQKRTEDTLRQSEKLAAMGELLAGVAHELNNPLAVVLAHANLLAKEVSGGTATRAAKISDAATRCARIVKNFLALARQEPAKLGPVSMSAIVHEALELLVYGLRVDNVAVRLELADGLPTLWADGHQLHQVLVNLVTNAHHALKTLDRTRTVTIRSGLDAARERVTLEVSDNGCGIPAAVLPRIFEPFFTTKPVGEGTGLGLPLCKAIVEEHGGTLEVSSADGAGSVFRVELPVRAPVGSIAAEGAAEVSAVPARSILVVDDEPEVAQVLADLLALDCHRVETAAHGGEALEKIERGAFDLVLSDLKMPRLDGPGLYRALVSRGHPLAERIVFITGDTLSAEARTFLAGTPVPRISKPFELAELRRQIREVVGAA